MPIDFNQQAFFDPKIDIIGKEVPLAEIEKTGNVLQNRFDKSYEQYSAADEALKQMEARANPVDREKAKELRSIYKEEMDKILEQGDFHNMRRQTENLARNAAINYKVIEEKNAAIQKGLEEIAKSPKYQLDPEGAKQDYLKSLKSINFNPDTRTIFDFNVEGYSGAADVNIPEKLLPIAPTLRSKYLKGRGSYFDTVTAPNGQKTIVVRTESGGVEKLPAGEIERELLSYIKTDPEVQAYISRDIKRAGIDPNSEEGKAAYQQLLLNRTQDATKALGNMYEIDKNDTSNTFTVAGGDLNNGGGANKKSLDRLLVPSTETSGITEDINPNQPNFPQKLVREGIIGNNKNMYHMLLDPLDDKISYYNEEFQKAKTQNEKNKIDSKINYYKSAKEMFKNYNKLARDYPEYKSSLAQIQSDEVGYTVQNLFDAFKGAGEQVLGVLGNSERADKFRSELNYLEGTYRAFINRGIVDSDIEQTIQEYHSNQKNKPVSTSIKMISPGIGDKDLQASFDYMGKVFNNTNVEVFKKSEKFDPEKPFEFRKVAREPRGNGTGILWEVQQKDSDGKIQTALVEPNYQGQSDLLENVQSEIYKTTGKNLDLVTANRFKNVKPFGRVNEERTIQEIFNEAELGNVDPKYSDIKIKKVKDGYIIPGSNVLFDSYLEAINALIP
jgi:hypothetical protein